MSSFENNMKDAFDGVEFQPSERVWAGVESAIGPKKKKGIFFMWQTYGVAAGLIIATTFGFLWRDGFFASNNKPTPETQLTAKSNDDSKVKDSLNTKAHLNEKIDKNALASSESNDENKSLSKQPLVNGLLAKTSNVESEGGKVAAKLTNDEATISDRIIDQNLLKAETVAAVDKSEVKTKESLTGEKKSSESILNESVLDTELSDLQASSNQKSDTDSIIKANAEALNTQSVASISRERSLNGSFGNNVLNISSGLGSADVVESAALREANNFSTLDGAVDNSEGEALGAISAGIGASFDMSKRLTLNVGLRYSEFKFRNSANSYSVEDGRSLPIYIPFGFDAENVFFIGTYNIENTIQSLFIQSTIGYKVATWGKLDVSFQLGAGIDYFLAYKVKGDLNFLDTRKANPSDSDFLNRTNFSGISGVSVNYRLNPKLGLSADFNYRRFFSSGNVSASSPSSAIGFGLSVNYFLTRKEE
ncbi:hypothetical protein [Roseivirga misakiensis]|uniref:Outer membrane protein beta-barrel domain-containing protein n=1 Tax=Roseivirga misakiensis TaxID=1563681 RepID=A0A1E5T0L0_9BACT|nr:hypothetical protein [Roseivirga misakiensis]OEK04922.1 hypothetical protein BFP71_15920 [Roseivirga misakiensis]